jgi:hypothetical protein
VHSICPRSRDAPGNARQAALEAFCQRPPVSAAAGRKGLHFDAGWFDPIWQEWNIRHHNKDNGSIY